MFAKLTHDVSLPSDPKNLKKPKIIKDCREEKIWKISELLQINQFKSI